MDDIYLMNNLKNRSKIPNIRIFYESGSQNLRMKKYLSNFKIFRKYIQIVRSLNSTTLYSKYFIIMRHANSQAGKYHPNFEWAYKNRPK